MIAVVTDSTSQLTADQADAAGITVVPMTVVLDDAELLEGVDLTAEQFYSRLPHGVRLATSQPSPGRFVETYRSLAAAGATEIVSVHVASEASGTLNSARLAAGQVEVPVHLVDSGMTSYGLGVIALRLAELAGTESSASLVSAAADMLPDIGTVFTLPDLDQVARGGRLRPPRLPDGSTDVPVLGGFGGRYDMIGAGHSVDSLVAAMAEFLLAGPGLRHVAIALAAAETIVFTEALEAQVRASDKVASMHRYRMGASVAVHVGPGTAGGFRWPAAAQ